jgi:RNA polymerase sigma-70 factor (ECF subfamily)
LKFELRDLLDRAQSGARVAFEDLVRLERPRLEAFVHGRLCADLARKVDIEDILQETFLRAFRDIRGFRHRDDDSFFRWLCGIAGHVILEFAKRHRCRPAVSLDFDVPANGTSPSRAARQEERFDRLQAAVDSLSPEHREVILLVRVEGLPVKEVAKRTKRTPHAVSNLLLRASHRLKEIMGETESLGLPARRLEEKRGEDHA